MQCNVTLCVQRFMLLLIIICQARGSAYFELGRRIASYSGDAREVTFLFQCISVPVQRFNCFGAQ